MKLKGSRTYQRLGERCLATMREVAPLAAVEPDRRRLDAGSVAPLMATRREK